MKKIFKKGYLYYTRSKGICQAILPDFFYFTFFDKCIHIWQKSEIVKCPSVRTDGHFSKGIFMKKIFKKGYLYYTRSKGICQAILPDFFYFTFFDKCIHIWQKSEIVKCPSVCTDGHFSKGIFMKKILRKDTYIIGCRGEFVKHFFYNSQILYNYASSADSNTCTSTLWYGISMPFSSNTCLVCSIKS